MSAQLVLIPNATVAPSPKAVATFYAAFAAVTATNPFPGPGPLAQPDVPRNVRVTYTAGWDGGNVTVNGTDQRGNPISEVIPGVAGTTQVGLKCFASISSAKKGTVGTAGTASIGDGDQLGYKPAAFGPAVAFVDGVSENVTLNPAAGGFTPTTVPDGLVKYALLID